MEIFIYSVTITKDRDVFNRYISSQLVRAKIPNATLYIYETCKIRIYPLRWNMKDFKVAQSSYFVSKFSEGGVGWRETRVFSRETETKKRTDGSRARVGREWTIVTMRLVTTVRTIVRGSPVISRLTEFFVRATSFWSMTRTSCDWIARKEAKPFHSNSNPTREKSWMDERDRFGISVGYRKNPTSTLRFPERTSREKEKRRESAREGGEDSAPDEKRRGETGVEDRIRE